MTSFAEALAARPRPSAWAPVVLAAGAALAMVGALLSPEPLLAIAVPVLIGAGWALYRLPLKTSAMVLLGLVFVLERMGEGLAAGGIFKVPLGTALAPLLFENLSAVTGVSLLRAPLIDVATIALFVVSAVRRRRDGWLAEAPSVRVLHRALWVSAAAVVVLLAVGVAQGGDFNEGLWQIRHTLMFPLRAVVLMRAFEGGTQELKSIGRFLAVVALFKALLGLYVVNVLAPGAELEYATSHEDTLLFVPALAMFFAMLIEGAPARTVALGALWVPVVFMGMVANDRRISYVSLMFGAIAMLFLSRPSPFKRVLTKVGLVAAPLMPLYLLAGWRSDGKGVFFPVGVFKSLLYGEQRHQAETDYRDLENLNILYTWGHHRFVPQGFGHPMEELFKLPDLSMWFENWQYHPHNSYLWFVTSAGPIGFTLIIAPMVIALYLAGRVYRAAGDSYQRVAALTAIVTLIAFFNQTWGDMGTRSWTVSWAAALAMAIMSKLAVRTGAWPTAYRADA